MSVDVQNQFTLGNGGLTHEAVQVKISQSLQQTPRDQRSKQHANVERHLQECANFRVTSIGAKKIGITIFQLFCNSYSKSAKEPV